MWCQTPAHCEDLGGNRGVEWCNAFFFGLDIYIETAYAPRNEYRFWISLGQGRRRRKLDVKKVKRLDLRVLYFRRRLQKSRPTIMNIY